MPNALIAVLLVEDNAGDAGLLREALVEAGPGRFRVDHAASLSAAREFLDHRQVCDVILLDLSLPDSRGLETVGRMHAAAPHVPIVVLTGFDDEVLGLDAIRSGAQDYLVKGQVDPRGLARTIRYAIERKGLETERERLVEALQRARDELERRVSDRTADLRQTVDVLQAEVRARTWAEEALRASEARLRLVLHQIPAIIWTTDAELRLTSSYGAGPAVSAPPLDEGSDAPWPAEGSGGLILPSHRRVLQGESLAYETELKDRTYQLNVEPLRAADGKIVGCLGIALDITEHRHLEEQRARLQGQLHHAHKLDMIGQLAAGLGHDFGNVLATVGGYTSLARTCVPADHPVVPALEAIEEAAAQARGITNALLSFGRQTDVRKGPLNLCAAMAESVRMLRHTLPASVELVTAACDPPLWIRADPVQIQQILLNLTLNARDAMPEGGRLEMTISPAAEADAVEMSEEAGSPGRYACFVVRDTGVGMSADVQPRIFEPFFTTKPRERGTGLGLSIIHGIVEDLRGRIRVASASGRGTAFTILLPCVEAPKPSDEASPGADAKADGVIVLVDGNPHVRGVLAAALGPLGYEIVQAGDTKGMLASCGEHRDRLRLVIVARETLSGADADCLRELRWNGRRVPVILLAEAGELGPGGEADTDITVLQRPFQMPRLKELVREKLEA